MKASFVGLVLIASALFVLGLLAGCSHDEDKLVTPGPRADILGLSYANPVEIEVDAVRHRALLLHDSGAALELVDLGRHSVLATRILVDYSDVYDVEFVNDHEACFAGHRIPGGGYAVQFVSLPDLTLGAMLVADTAGSHGYLCVDTADACVYYSHSGGGSHDAVYKIAVGTHQFVDADDSSQAPHGLDNDVVHGIFNRPSRMVFDYATRMLSVANDSGDYITVIDSTVWGRFARGGSTSFPGSGMSSISMLSGGLTRARADAMCGVAGYDVFAGMSGTSAFLSRFGSDPIDLYLLQVMPGRTWRHSSPSLRIHPRADIVSAFILQHDSSGTSIGQYRLNGFPAVGSPFRTQTIPDSSISAFGLDVASDQLVVGDSHVARLEIINLR